MVSSSAVELPPTPETTLVVMLGAGTYPRKPVWTNPVLEASARAFLSYVVSPGGLAVPAEQVLDLFDDDAPAAKQCEVVEAFLRGDAFRRTRDLIVYYVGHGGFDGEEYYLAVRDTAKDREFLSAIESPKLARIILESFGRRRVFVILDSCFAASAASDWQGTELELAVKRMSRRLPKRGTAFLAAASKDDVALAPRSGAYTMFTGELLRSLQRGLPGGDERLSLYELYELIRDGLNGPSALDGPRPELHAPRQNDGDISLLPMFPNSSYRRRMIGEVIKGFKITGRLGKGAMGEVWVAEQQIVKTKVAIKVLSEDLSRDRELVERFFGEAVAVSRVKHAGIVKISDVGVHDGAAYLIMELLEGETLAARIGRLGRLPLWHVGVVGAQIASVMDATHAAQITHRDLKPDNIFLVQDHEMASGERVKVLDFGIAKLGTGQTLAGRMMGTPNYMAPEQWADAAAVDARADVYALGCIAFEMCCGRPPFVASSIAEAYARHANETPLRTSAVAPDVPPALDDVVAAALAKEPSLRPSMKELQRVFAAIATEEPAAPAVSKLSPRPGMPALPSTRRWGGPPDHQPAAGDAGSRAGELTSTPHSQPIGAAPVHTVATSSIPATEAPSGSAVTPQPRRAWLTVGAAAVVVVGIVAFAMLRGSGSPGDGTRPPGRGSASAASVPDAPLAPVAPSSLAVAAPPDAAPLDATPPPDKAELAKVHIRKVLTAFVAWASTHARAPCPRPSELASSLGDAHAVDDPWGHTLRITCTDQPVDQKVGVISAGPDGVFKTADDVVSWKLGRDVTSEIGGRHWAGTQKRDAGSNVDDIQRIRK